MTEKSDNINRRDFSNIVLGAGAAALGLGILYPIGRYVIPPETGQKEATEIVGTMETWPKGSAQIKMVGGKTVIIVRKKDGEFVALGAICTHADCTVEYEPEKEGILCNCHGGRFDLTGKVIGGPPPRPLQVYKVKTRINEDKKVTEVIVST